MTMRRAGVFGRVIAVALALGACTAADALDVTTTSQATSTTTSTSTSTSTTTSTTTTVPVTTTTLEVPAVDAPLVAVGQKDGAETARVQQRLLDAGFWLSGVDGDFGLTTRQAVMAFQKYSGLEPSGRVDDATAAALTTITLRPRPQTTDPGVVVEVDKSRQLLLVVNDAKVLWVLNTSTGSGQWYLEQNQKDPTKWELGRSITDSGRFKIRRERSEGWWAGDLGEIYRPKYFNGGIAIHGSRSIPNYPASHGCVRVSVPAMDMLWESRMLPIGTTVWVYGEDVEAANEKPTMPTTTTTTTLAPDVSDSTASIESSPVTTAPA
jgi:lipoprotein-anchoring transpeptidase ErfK/SrfK